MSAFSPARRAEVAARAGHRCEYCHLPARGQVATFPIDHIDPRSAGGGTDLGNLASACPHCNAHKWTTVESADPSTGRPIRIFHPRTDDWAEHFEWLGDGILSGKSPTGRATIAALKMNADDMVELRRLLAALALFPEAS